MAAVPFAMEASMRLPAYSTTQQAYLLPSGPSQQLWPSQLFSQPPLPIGQPMMMPWMVGPHTHAVPQPTQFGFVTHTTAAQVAPAQNQAFVTATSGQMMMSPTPVCVCFVCVCHCARVSLFVFWCFMLFYCCPIFSAHRRWSFVRFFHFSLFFDVQATQTQTQAPRKPPALQTDGDADVLMQEGARKDATTSASTSANPSTNTSPNQSPTGAQAQAQGAQAKTVVPEKNTTER